MHASAHNRVFTPCSSHHFIQGAAVFFGGLSNPRGMGGFDGGPIDFDMIAAAGICA
jgi:hypothetical protein